jgi:ribosomal protein L3
MEVVKVDPERNLLLVKGPVPGANKGEVQVRIPTRLYKSKARKQAEALKG